MMTKTDFEALAEALRECRVTADPALSDPYTLGAAAQWRSTRERIIAACYASNPRFKRETFIAWTER